MFLHILGVASFDKLVTLGFGNNVLLFLMGAMGLSAAMTSSGLARRFMLWMLTKVGRRTDRIVLAFIAIGTMTSMWVTDMAVAAMLLPLGVSILESSGCKPLQSNFGRALMIDPGVRMFLEVENLQAGYGTEEVLHGVSLRVDEGEIVSILGANGAGKTTTLLTISGLVRASGGAVRFQGEDRS